jgi:YbbR domain-containing protein
MTRNPKINKILNSKVFWAVISLLAAVLLWMFVTTTEGTEKTMTFSGVKVQFVGEENMRDSRGLIITDVENNSVSVTLRGSVRTMSKLDATNIVAQIDLSSENRTGLMQRAYTLVYPSGVDRGDITEVSLSPQVITFSVDKLSTKPVEVQGRFDGSAAEGYMTEPIEVSPGTVRISGPAAEIDQVDHALVVIDRQDVDKTVTMETDYILVDADNNPVEYESIELETPTVTATLPVLSTKEVPLSVTLISGGGATSENCRVDIEPKTITLAGDAEILDGINKIDLGTIDLAEVGDSYEDTFSIIIPNDTENLIGATEATVNIEVRGLETKKFTVTNFSCINTTDGYTAEVITQSLEVTIRAEADVLDQVAANNIRAVADLNGYGDTTGIVYPPAKIYVDGFSNAGAVGPYRVYVSIELG